MLLRRGRLGHHCVHHGQRGAARVYAAAGLALCVVRASQVVETLPEYFAAIKSGQRTETGAEALPKLVTWISGPSATADIEMTRIKGVHGPRFLNVILVKD